MDSSGSLLRLYSVNLCFEDWHNRLLFFLITVSVNSITEDLTFDMIYIYIFFITLSALLLRGSGCEGLVSPPFSRPSCELLRCNVMF